MHAEPVDRREGSLPSFGRVAPAIRGIHGSGRRQSGQKERTDYLPRDCRHPAVKCAA